MNTMLGIHDLWLFMVSAVLVNISPGPDSAYIVGRSLQLGWRAGMMAALGISNNPAGRFLGVDRVDPGW